MHVNRRHHWVFFLALSIAWGTAWAEEGSGLKFIIKEQVQYDSNLFRLSTTANATALVGRSSPAETVAVTTLGLHYEKAYSLQFVEFDVSAVKYDYQNFNYLDFSALNYSAAWRWSYTPHVYGRVTTSRTKTLNSFVDTQNFRIRNERVDTVKRADITYELGARWRVLGALAQYAQDNQQSLIAESGFRQTNLEAGARYVLPTGSYVGINFRNSDGHYTDLPVSALSLFDNQFTQNEGELDLFWAFSGKTTANARLGFRSREHPNIPQRDFSGVIGSARVNWQATGKSLVTAGWTRDLSAYQTSTTNYYKSDRFYVGPVWELGAKTSVSLLLAETVRAYGGSPFGLVASHRQDNMRDISLSFDWEPLRYMTLNATLQNSKRRSNQPGLDYTSNTINLSAQLKF